MVVGIRRGDGRADHAAPAGRRSSKSGDCLFTFGKGGAISSLTERDGVESVAQGEEAAKAMSDGEDPPSAAAEDEAAEG